MLSLHDDADSGCKNYNHLKKKYKKIQRLASLGIMGDELRASLKLPRTSQSTMALRGFSGVLNWDSIMPRGLSP